MASKVQVINQTGSTCLLILEILMLTIKCMYIIAIATYYFFKEKSQKSVKNDIVLVTGAGHGIGRELAKKYASEGATVVCWDVNKQRNEETINEIARLGFSKAYGYICDVSNYKQVEEVSKRVKTEVGCVTILINNAGIAYVKSILEASPSQIENTIKINTMAHFWTIKAFLPEMVRSNRGHIVAISSIAGLYGARSGTHYCSSKFAIRGIMESLYQELRLDPYNKVNLTTIYPSGVNTGIFKKAVVRFPSFLPIISPKQAAEYIVKAQRQNIIEFSVPSYTLTAHTLMRLLPPKGQEMVFDFFGTYVVE